MKKTRMHHLYQKSIRQEALVIQFENDNEQYVKNKRLLKSFRVSEKIGSKLRLVGKTDWKYLKL